MTALLSRIDDLRRRVKERWAKQRAAAIDDALMRDGWHVEELPNGNILVWALPWIDREAIGRAYLGLPR